MSPGGKVVGTFTSNVVFVFYIQFYQFVMENFMPCVGIGFVGSGANKQIIDFGVNTWIFKYRCLVDPDGSTQYTNRTQINRDCSTQHTEQWRPPIDKTTDCP